jgi:hypothetical protein
VDFTQRHDACVLYTLYDTCNIELLHRVYVACIHTTALVICETALQASYFLGIALRKQLRYAEAASHLEKALEATYESGDSIKDEVWREVAACKHSWWLQEATARRDKQIRLKGRLKLFMDAYYLTNSSVCAIR